MTDASGGLLDNGIPVVCGGVNEDWETSGLCYKMISANKWKRIANMSIERSSFSSAVTKWGFLVVGGKNRAHLPTGEVELLKSTDSTFRNMRSFPKEISSGCMATLDNGTIILTGGYFYGNELINSVWRNVDIMGGDWEQANANMAFARAEHSCEVVRDTVHNREKLIVVGGTVHGSPGSKSVEILDLKDGVWEEGPMLPMEVSRSQLIKDGKGGCLLVGGREVIDSRSRRLNSILHISSDLKEWKQLGRKMKTGRASHVAMLVSDGLMRCIT